MSVCAHARGRHDVCACGNACVSVYVHRVCARARVSVFVCGCVGVRCYRRWLRIVCMLQQQCKPAAARVGANLVGLALYKGRVAKNTGVPHSPTHRRRAAKGALLQRDEGKRRGGAGFSGSTTSEDPQHNALCGESYAEPGANVW